MAASHKVYIDPTSLESIQGNPGEEISLPLLFEPSDSELSTGIQFFVHYDSNSLTPLAPADLAADIFANTWDSPEADAGNTDTDSSTDKSFELNWLSFMGNFPGGETTYPTKIATLKFKISENAEEISEAPTINFIAGEMASGYTFEGTSITLGDESEDEPTDPVITGPSGDAGDFTAVATVSENTTAVHTFTADETVTWSLNESPDKDKFVIDETTGALSFAAAPDFETPSSLASSNAYNVQIKATDESANTSSTQTLTVNVSDVEEVVVDETAPVIFCEIVLMQKYMV